MSLESEILSLLKADSVVKGIVDNRLRLEWFDQDTQLPALAISRISGGRDSALDMSDYFNTARVQIDCQADKYEKVKDLVDAIKNVLHGYRGLIGSYQIESLSYENEIDLGAQTGDYRVRRVALDFFVLFL